VDVLARLKQLMNERGWTMYRLAKECGLNESTIANIYRRNALPSIPTLEIICRGFGITLSQFFADNELVELNSELKEVFDYWLSLTAEQKEAVLLTMKAFHHDK
jgi:transcriptional regulator with XRE-family HTH domain